MDDVNKNQPPDSQKTNEDKFLQILKKEKSITPIPTKHYKKNKIHSHMRILSLHQLDIKPLKYYKFPFTHIKNYTPELHKEWLIAVKDIFNNFTNNGQKFYILFIDSVLIFKDEKVKTDLKLISLFKKEDINYVIKGEYVYIKDFDVKILFDFIINYEYMTTLPFILSRHRFINSIYSINMMKKCGVVKNKGLLQHHSTISGYFFVNDYRKLLMHDIIFDS